MPTTEKIMFWNVENFFGSSLDNYLNKPDKVFDVEYYRQPGIFAERCNRLADRVATFSGNAKGPEVLGLCELEMSTTTLTALRDNLNTALSTSYTLAYRQTRGHRNITTALLTRWTVNSTKVIAPDRRVIEVSTTRLGTNITFFIVHFPSKLSDEEGVERRVTAQVIYQRIVALGAGSRVVVMGDFNDNPSNDSLATDLAAGASTANAIASTWPTPVLYNCHNSTSFPPPPGGTDFTHYFKGPPISREILDQILVTGPLLTGDPLIKHATTAIHTTGISKTDPVSGLTRPWAWNDSDAPGYSDHYAVSVDIEWA